MGMTARCTDFEATVAKSGDAAYLILTCTSNSKKKVYKCFEVVVSGDSLSVGGVASLTFIDKIDMDIVLKSLQAFGNWLAKRLNEGRSRVGYIEEMIAKFVAYSLCKERGRIVECLKQCKLVTRKGPIGWKAVYQMFVNTKDMPKQVEEPKFWAGELPEECTRSSSSASSS